MRDQNGVMLGQHRPTPTMPRREPFTSPWEGARRGRPAPVPFELPRLIPAPQEGAVPIPVPVPREGFTKEPTLIPAPVDELTPGEVRQPEPAATCAQAAYDFANGCRQLANLRKLILAAAKFIESEPYDYPRSELLETRYDGLLEVEQLLLDLLNDLALQLEECGCTYSQTSCTVRCPEGRFYSPQGKDLIEYKVPDFPMPTFREMFPPGPSWWEQGFASTGGELRLAPQRDIPGALPTIPEPLRVARAATAAEGLTVSPPGGGFPVAAPSVRPFTLSPGMRGHSLGAIITSRQIGPSMPHHSGEPRTSPQLSVESELLPALGPGGAARIEPQALVPSSAEIPGDQLPSGGSFPGAAPLWGDVQKVQPQQEFVPPAQPTPFGPGGLPAGVAIAGTSHLGGPALGPAAAVHVYEM